jgi:hypothetical protein
MNLITKTLSNDLQETIDKLKSLPEEIRVAREELGNFSEIDILTQRIDLIKADIMFEVRNETKDGKLAHTNEGARESRMLQLLQANPEFKEATLALQKIKSEKQQKEAEIEKKINEFKVHRSLARLYASIMESD